jgi:hypothetical protein
MIALLLALACTSSDPQVVDSSTPYVEEREACAESFPERTALFGDLHVHTALSFDAGGYGTQLRTADALAFAKGGAVTVPPFDEDGGGGRTAQLARPLDFVGVTEHAELLGEVAICTDPDLEGYESDTCESYRTGNGAFEFGSFMAALDPVRATDICGEDGARCLQAASERWAEMRDATEAAYDRTEACSFSAFPSYEYTNTESVSNLHRNVIFKNDMVPELPVTYYEAPTPEDLWTQLASQCKDAGTGCDVLVIPHNSNLSNGQLFIPRNSSGGAADAELTELRSRMEPLVEVFQHKGDSECRNGFEDVDAEEDPLCEFEKLRPADDTQCGEEPGTGGMRLWGCAHRLDFVRQVLKEGLAEESRVGSNPYRLGFIGSTDTHSGIPGHVDSVDFLGHVGTADDTLEERLGEGTVTHDAVIYNPGGLAGVWATENTRTAIFEALQRKETFSTSGPRITVRLFAGADLPLDLCEREDRLELADAGGVPMGGEVQASGDGPVFVAWADKDPGTSDRPGTDLQRLQIIKGWRDSAGNLHESVIEIAGDENNGAAVDTDTCEVSGKGSESLCAVWTDPDFDPSSSAFYYLRAVENPTCRWSTIQCKTLKAKAPEAMPSPCTDGSIPQTVQQRAWSSPIWVSP